MQHRLTISRSGLDWLTQQLATRAQFYCRAGVSRLEARTEWLLHGPQYRFDQAGAQLVVFSTQDAATIVAEIIKHMQRIGPEVGVVLALGAGPAAGHMAAACRSTDRWLSLDSIQVVAPGLPCLEISHGSNRPVEHSDELLSGEAWSRTIGALGDAAWRRIRGLHAVVVGCGRTGSLLSTGLRRAGLRGISLIDADRIELHNLGEMDGVDLNDISRTKVEAVAQRLESQKLPRRCTVNALPESVFSLSALVAIKQADWVFCCVDNPAARLATAFLATVYLKPMIDIGTGILDVAGQRIMGLDVRLVEPGRCLLCLGGIASVRSALDMLRREVTPTNQRPTPGDFRDERMGSLRSLNELAVGFAMRALEEYLYGTGRQSTWLHFEIGAVGDYVLQHQDATTDVACRMCRWAGGGDDRLAELRSALAASSV